MGNPYAPPRPDAPQQPGPEAQQPDAARQGTTTPPSAPPAPPHAGPPAFPERPPVPQPPAPQAPPEPAEPDPELARRATRRVLHFGLLLLAVIVVSTMPFPWQAVSLALALGAIVVGIRALVAVWRARVRGALVPALAIGVGLAGMLALQMVATLATWDIAIAHQRCLDGAITVSASNRCEAERQQALDEWVSRLSPAPAAS